MSPLASAFPSSIWREVSRSAVRNLGACRERRRALLRAGTLLIYTIYTLQQSSQCTAGLAYYGRQSQRDKRRRHRDFIPEAATAALAFALSAPLFGCSSNCVQQKRPAKLSDKKLILLTWICVCMPDGFSPLPYASTYGTGVPRLRQMHSLCMPSSIWANIACLPMRILHYHEPNISIQHTQQCAFNLNQR